MTETTDDITHLVVTLKQDEFIAIGPDIVLRFFRENGKFKLWIDAPRM